MTTDRFIFQRECAGKVNGKVLNIGCKEDPAGLKNLYGDRIVNLDILDYDEDKLNNHGERVSIPVDVVHDATKFPWPFEDDSFDLALIGDLLEDLPDDGCQIGILGEARRVAKHLCVTCPEDGPERDAHHRTRISPDMLRVMLEATLWKIDDFRIVDYGFVPRGTFVFAHRDEEKYPWLEETSSSSTKTTPSPD